MFTSIQLLRNSTAQQDRVTRVANNLKKINRQWKDHWLFPVMAIGLSNSGDDVDWVLSNSSVLMSESSQKRIHLCAGADDKTPPVLPFNSLVNKIKQAFDVASDVSELGIRKQADLRLAEIDAVLSAHHPGASWKFGVRLVEEEQKDQKAASTVDATPKTAAAAAAAKIVATVPGDAVSEETKSEFLEAAQDAWHRLTLEDKEAFLASIFEDCESGNL